MILRLVFWGGIIRDFPFLYLLYGIFMNKKIIGNCEICARPMYDGLYVNRHHLIPKAKGGSHGEQITLHEVCHNKIQCWLP